MVCGKHLKAKYVRCLINYHLFIFFSILILLSVSVVFFVYQRNPQGYGHFLRGFQAYRTKTSDDYRKLFALLRETQISHLYPHFSTNEIYQQNPYPSYEGQIDPSRKRFYLPTCPIVRFSEIRYPLVMDWEQFLTDLDQWKSICRWEWMIRREFSPRSSCEYLGPITLLFNHTWKSLDQCEQISRIDLEQFHHQWFSCHLSSCSNEHLHYYLTSFNSSSILKIYLHLQSNEVIRFYQLSLTSPMMDINLDSTGEEILFIYLIRSNWSYLGLSVILYFLSLLFFVKNLFFLFIVVLHLCLSLIFSSIVYFNVFHLPLTLLNISSVTLYVFIVFIDSFLWYTCWFINDHRRDDCTIYRTIENLLTQIFYYLVPKNLIALIILMITYSNRIIALQCFTVSAILLIFSSFFISFTLYPVAFICMLRYQSSILTLQRCLQHLLTKNRSNCFFDRTIPYLIVRLKVFWLTSFTLLTCIALSLLLHWPKLNYNIRRPTFDLLRTSMTTPVSHSMMEIDVTYYIGSHWEMPNESLIPRTDIPVLDYNVENKMTSHAGTSHTFAYALTENLTQLMDLCSQLNSIQTFEQHINIQPLIYRHYPSNHSLLPSLSNIIFHSPLSIKDLHCFGDLSSMTSSSTASQSKFTPIIMHHSNQSINCSSICPKNKTAHSDECIRCLNVVYYRSKAFDDQFILKNGLRFIGDAQNPRYLLQTVTYQWNFSTPLNQFSPWFQMIKALRNHFLAKFYSKTFTHMSVWWSSEVFATFTIMEQLEKEKYSLLAIKFLLIAILLVLFTGVLGLFVTLTIFFNFICTMAILTLCHFQMTVENMAFFTIVLILSSQYSVLYSMSYKLAPTFFFQRENRTLYSLKQLCTTLFHVTFSIIILSSPCLFSSVPYLFKSAIILIASSLISLIYSTLFLQSLLCLIGPAGQACCWTPCHLTLTRHSNASHGRKSTDLSARSSSNTTRRHQRMSTSSYFASSYFSQIFTGSTYFESDYGGINETLAMIGRRRESSRSHQAAYTVKRASLLTGEIIELYTPRASLAPHTHHHLHHPRYSRQSSVSRGVPMTGLVRPLYISPSVSPHSQLSIHSQAASGRPRSPSPQTARPSRSPSPHSLVQNTTSGLLRPCHSAPRLHVPLYRVQTSPVKQSPTPTGRMMEKTLTIIPRRSTVTSSTEDLSPKPRRSILKSTTTGTGRSSWLKRSNSS